MIHQIFLKWAMEKDLLMPYAKDIDTWQYVTSPFAKSSLGVDNERTVRTPPSPRPRRHSG